MHVAGRGGPGSLSLPSPLPANINVCMCPGYELGANEQRWVTLRVVFLNLFSLSQQISDPSGVPPFPLNFLPEIVPTCFSLSPLLAPQNRTFRSLSWYLSSPKRKNLPSALSFKHSASNIYNMEMYSLSKRLKIRLRKAQN